MGRWLQRRRWRLGNYFCETGEREILRQINELRIVHTAEMLALQTAQAEVVRLMALNELHRRECDERGAELDRRLRAMGTDYLETLRIIAGEPSVKLVKEG